MKKISKLFVHGRSPGITFSQKLQQSFLAIPDFTFKKILSPLKSKLVTVLLFFIPFLYTGQSLAQPLLSDEKDTTVIESALPENSIIFEDIHAQSSKESLRISWSVNHEISKLPAVSNSSVSIIYNESEAQETGRERIDGINLKSGSYSISGLKENKEYHYSIGLVTPGGEYWSDSYKATTGTKWGFFNFLGLIGALALFLYGMKIMSDGLQLAAGSKLRNLLGSMTSNPAKGILTGLGITALIQSSSVTTVMTVSFVNAGIMTLYQSAGVVMGANIGTTVTAWIIDLLGFKVDIAPYTLIILAAGVPLLFAHSSKIKGWGSTIVGLALLFMGLNFLKEAVPVLDENSGIVQFFVSINDLPVLGTIICVVFGAVMTIIIQSSSATIALTMTLMATGILPFEAGAAMVLGENIGTTITAEIASSVGNVYAKRTARIHSMFNIIGVTWVLLVFPYFLKLIVFLTEMTGAPNPIISPQVSGSTGLVILHTTFNLANVLVMVWFIPGLVKLAERTVRSKGEEDEQFKLDYIGTANFTTPELSVLEAKREIAKFGEITSRMLGFTRELFLEQNKKNQRHLLSRISKYEEITDRVEIEVADYLNHISLRNVDKKLSSRILGMNRIVSNLERIGDIFFQISKTFEKKEEDKISFTTEQEERILELMDMLERAFDNMNKNLNMHAEEVTLDKAQEIENQINSKRNEINMEYHSSVFNTENNGVRSALMYNNIFASLERIGDHIINVTEGIKGKL